MLDDFFNNNENKIDKNIADNLLNMFKDKFIIPDYNPNNQRKSWLLWCNLVCKTQMIPTENFDRISIDLNKMVYFYSERHRTMYHVAFEEIRNLISELEPWEEIDAEIFDDTFDWLIAITHEDVTLVYGL